MWYYSLNNKPAGPVDSDTIKSLLRAGTINMNTLVWQEGMPDWKKLGETSLAVPEKPVVQPVVPVYPPYQPGQPMAPLTPAMPQYSAYPTQATTTPPPFFSQVKFSSLKNLFTAWIVLFSIANIISIVFLFVPEDTGAYQAIACSVSAFGIAAAILMYILVYQFWKVLQDGYADTTPVNAWVFLIIPLFNMYWAFRAFYGLSKNQNSFIDRHYSMIAGLQVRRPKPVISLIYCFGFILNYVVSIVIYVTSYSGNAPFYESNPALMIGYAVFCILYMISALLAFTDFYLTSKSILENQR